MKTYFQCFAFALFGAVVIGCKSVAKYPIDEHPIVRVDTNLIGIWKMAEDTDVHNYFVIEERNDYEYAVTYMNRGGSNRTYENFAAFFSLINNTRFFNVRYWNYDWETKISDEGYFFLKGTSKNYRSNI